MHILQRPIGSGFSAQSTAAEVLHGVSLAGKVAIVTGGYSGIGLETTRALTRAGAHVVVPARRPVLAREALKEVSNAEVDQLDLSDLEDVRRFAERFLASGRQIDILMNNAGIMACPETRVGPGWEAQFAINHLGHYALVNRLWPALARGGARVISVSSAAHHFSPMRWHDLHFTNGYDKVLAYGQSKTANILFAVQLDILGRREGVRAFSLHPGSILTPLQRYLSREEMIASGWIDEQGTLIDPTFKTAQQGASTQVWAATSPSLEGLGGLYCEDCDIARLATGDSPPLAGVQGYAIDLAQAEQLWTRSARLTGLNTIAPS